MSKRDIVVADLVQLDETMIKTYSATAIQAFIRMMEKWNMSVIECCAILGGVPKQTYEKWVCNDVGRLSIEQLERISVLLGIYKTLKLLFCDEGGRQRWLKSPNHDYAFNGLSPAERLARGGIDDIYAVQRYVDGFCQ
ncbi:MAG: hypothetical protein ACI8WB_002859 [Phenylobacterium sp.]|jgi:hypothetical protein